MQALKGMVAVVTGASKGIGKGIAEGLGEAGCTVYLTGRTTSDEIPLRPLTIEATAASVESFGGVAIPVALDHNNDEEVRADRKSVV